MSQNGHSHDKHDNDEHDQDGHDQDKHDHDDYKHNDHEHDGQDHDEKSHSQGGHSHGHGHSHGSDGHGHTHGVIDPTIATTDRGIWAIKWSFIGLMATALFQVSIVILSGSVALFADTIHNFGDASTAIPPVDCIHVRAEEADQTVSIWVWTR
jgi:hypothetical protein